MYPHRGIFRPSVSRRTFLKAAGAGTLLPLLPGCGDSGDSSLRLSNTIQWGRTTIQEKLQANSNIAAVSVALLWNDDLVWQEAFGVSSPKSGTAATTSTRFNIGSVSKVLAGLSAMILQDTGQFHIDEPVARYLPQFRMLSPQFQEITSRHLLCHSSGLPGSNLRGMFTFTPELEYARDTEEGLANFHLKHRPGELHVYCNDGFTLFERVVLAVTGMSYPEFVQQHIFEPLEMVHSGYPLAILPEGTYAHPVNNGEEFPQESVNAYATGGAYSTPGDMMQLASMFINRGLYKGRRIVSEEGVELMGSDQTARAILNPSPEWKWGLGWDATRQSGMEAVGVRAWQKNGGTLFFQTEYFVLPDIRMALHITGNMGYQPLNIAEGILLRALDEIGAIPSAPSPLPYTPPQASSPDTTFTQFSGIYGSFLAPVKVTFEGPGSMSLNVWREGHWTPMDADAELFSLRDDGWWWTDKPGAPSYRFDEVDTLEGGQTVRHRYLIVRSRPGNGHYYMSMPVGEQLAPREALPPVWRQRLGTRWVLANDTADSLVSLLEGNTLDIGELPELPGYVMVNGEQLLTPFNDQRAGMSVKIPVNHGRDLIEIFFESGSGGTVLRMGSSIYTQVTD